VNFVNDLAVFSEAYPEGYFPEASSADVQAVFVDEASL